MNHAEELNKIITLAGRRTDFKSAGFQPFEQETPSNLDSVTKAGNLFFTTSVLGMEAISHVIEDQALSLGGSFSFYTGFQKFSRMMPQRDRYVKLARTGNPINVFGIPDIRPWSESNMNIITLEKVPSLEEPSLAHNWFVVLNNPKFVSMALVANELPRARSSTMTNAKLVYRNFEGFWTYSQPVIDQVVNILDDYIRVTKNIAAQVKTL